MIKKNQQIFKIFKFEIQHVYQKMWSLWTTKWQKTNRCLFIRQSPRFQLTDTYVSNEFHLMDLAQSECCMRAILKMHAHNQSAALMWSWKCMCLIKVLQGLYLEKGVCTSEWCHYGHWPCWIIKVCTGHNIRNVGVCRGILM